MKRAFLLLIGLVALQLPWLDRPVHYDEANFLTLARGAATDPWRPHDVRINWQGIEERAFDVLSNPPGIAWWLAPVVEAPVVAQRAWMLLWLPLAAWGAWRLGRRFLGEGERGAILVLTAPIALLSTPALLPDAPLFALTLAGVAGFVDATDARRPAWGWAVLAGAAVLFRYSGVAVVPLLAAYALLHRRPPWSALAALAPLAALAAHDAHAYGAVHLLAMGKFQSVSNTPLDLFHKLVASTAMLGGAAALPFFPWSRAAFGGALVGAAAGAPWGIVGAAFAAAGGAVLGQVAGRAFGADDALGGDHALGAGGADGGEARAGAPHASATRAAAARARRADALWLAAWVFGGLAFLLTLRFTATRYWLPFLPPAVLVVGARWPRALLVANVSLGMLLAADERFSARAQVALAERVGALGDGVFAGHWGWQWALEQAGWRAIDAGARPAPGTLVALPRQAWPQPVDMACIDVLGAWAAPPPLPWLPRGYTEAGRANLHANWIVGDVRTVAPWTFASDPYEQARVCRD